VAGKDEEAEITNEVSEESEVESGGEKITLVLSLLCTKHSHSDQLLSYTILFIIHTCIHTMYV